MQKVEASGLSCKESILCVRFRGLRIKFRKSFKPCANAHTSNNRVCKICVIISVLFFIKTIRIYFFCKHSCKLEIRTLRFRATCNERGARSSPRNLQRAQSAKFPAQLATSAKREVPRAETASVSHYTARRKRRTVYPQKELQSAFMPFITSERMSYKNLRTDKRKTFRHFLTSNSGAISDRVFYHASFLFVRRLISHTAS